MTAGGDYPFFLRFNPGGRPRPAK